MWELTSHRQLLSHNAKISIPRIHRQHHDLDSAGSFNRQLSCKRTDFTRKLQRGLGYHFVILHELRNNLNVIGVPEPTWLRGAASRHRDQGAYRQILSYRQFQVFIRCKQRNPEAVNFQQNAFPENMLSRD